MSMIQVRNVPEELHRELKARAAREGVTLSDFVLHELERVAAVPSNAELRARLLARPAVEYLGETAAESTRAERDAR